MVLKVGMCAAIHVVLSQKNPFKTIKEWIAIAGQSLHHCAEQYEECGCKEWLSVLPEVHEMETCIGFRTNFEIWSFRSVKTSPYE